MITARRLREAAERERLGQTHQGPPPPAVISYTEHQREVAKLNMAHARELSALRRELSGGAAVEGLETKLTAAEKQNSELVGRVAELEEMLSEATQPAEQEPAPEQDKSADRKKGSQRSRG